MLSSRGSALAAFGALVLAAGAAFAGTVMHPDIVHHQSHDTNNPDRITMITLDAGPADGLLPGMKGTLRGGGVTDPFVIDRVLSSTASMAFTGVSANLVQTKAVDITPTKTCTFSSAKPDWSTAKDIAAGKAPPGYVFAEVTYTGENKGPLPGDEACEGGFRFDIDKGYESVLPGAPAYSIIPASGTPYPVSIKIAWASTTAAGGCAVGVGTSSQSKATFKAQKMLVARSHCKKI